MEIETLKDDSLVSLRSLSPGTAFLSCGSLFMVMQTDFDPTDPTVAIVSLEDGSTAHWNGREEVLPVKAKVVYE